MDARADSQAPVCPRVRRFRTSSRRAGRRSDAGARSGRFDKEGACRLVANRRASLARSRGGYFGAGGGGGGGCGATTASPASVATTDGPWAPPADMPALAIGRVGFTGSPTTVTVPASIARLPIGFGFVATGAAASFAVIFAEPLTSERRRLISFPSG